MKAAADRRVAVLLGAGSVAWAAAPVTHTGYSNLALLAASLGMAAGALRLRFLKILRLVPWEEGALVAVLWLEVLHRARPWHTAVLGAALIAYLLATHLAESGASPRVLRPQIRFLAIGAGLLALAAGAGAAMVPKAGPGPGSALLQLIAAGALIAAAVLVFDQLA